MDSLGEVGKKMRSAIKAKLIELGNANQTGYIDDELPDYVMIMVANKRSKQQMLTDLTLFLGANTENFVNWLHQVLQKLQEVTLPSSLASKAKKKIESSLGGKKDKKKDKKKGGKEPSITDVIAAELMEKAKNIEPFAVKKEEKSRTPSPPPAPQISEDRSPQTPSPPRISSSSNSQSQNNNDEFDIPTISEIATSASSQQLHTKELSQLQELQNRIYQTKNKEQTPSSEGEEKDEEEETASKPTENSKPSTIISLSAIRKTESEIVKNSLKSFIQKQKLDNDKRDAKRSTNDRRDIRERIEYRASDRNRGRERRSRSPISRDRYRPKRRSRSRSPIERKARPSIHDRIGSRVSSKRSKSPEAEKREILKVKRPTLSSAIIKPQSRSMFLKAITEAHKSTTMKPDTTHRHQNLVIRVNSRNDDEYVPQSISSHSESESAQYHPSKNRKNLRSQPSAIDDDDNVVCLNNNDVDLDDLEGESEQPRKSPQFIVSLEGIDTSHFDDNTKSSKSPTPPPVIKRNKRSVKERIGLRPLDQLMEEPPRATKRRAQPVEEEEVDEEEVECESQRAYNKIKRSKVSPIKFDLTDEENEDDGKSRGSSCDHSPKKSKRRSDENGEEQKRIRLETTRSFDHVPALLSSVAIPVPDSAKPIVKSKERCKFYPACTNTSCPFHHPSLPCKVFPLCKFGDSCAYIHPRCKFDVSCNRNDCNFTHTPLAAQSSPIVASAIVPVQNYKSIQISSSATICKFFPACTNTNCTFLHPKSCKFGKGCINKADCNFYHFEMTGKSKFKWISPLS